MSTLTSPPFPPPSISSTPTSISSAGQSRSSSVLPLQQPVSSASQLPSSSSRLHTTTSSQFTSNQYIEHSRKLMEHQRQLHEEERALWDLERNELHLRIQELEDMVHKLGGHATTFASPARQFGAPAVPGVLPIPTHSRLGGPMNNNSIGYQVAPRANSTGNEFWRGAGGKSDAHPTRSFSEAPDPTQLLKSANHLPIITEDSTSRTKSVGFVGIEPEATSPPLQNFYTHPVPGHSNFRGPSSIPGDRISASLDGISFKSSSIVAKAISSNSATPSPLGTPASHAAQSSAATSAPPSAVPKPVLLNLPASGLTEDDLLKKDAGHTPLVKLTGADSIPSSQDTPVVRAAEKKQQSAGPVELQPRQPLERSDSYFPTVEDDSVPALSEDPALGGPLGLKGDPASKENEKFLSQLDTKLLQAQRSNSMDTASEDSQEVEVMKARSAEDRPVSRDGSGLGNEEPEPRLRIKRSTNFGSVFGARVPGQGLV